MEMSFGWCRGRMHRQEVRKDGKESEKEMEEVIFLLGHGLGEQRLNYSHPGQERI